MIQQRRITQHKRFVPYGTHPNFCFAKTSFMLEPLSEIAGDGFKDSFNKVKGNMYNINKEI